jgi:hypothetical protein
MLISDVKHKRHLQSLVLIGNWFQMSHTNAICRVSFWLETQCITLIGHYIMCRWYLRVALDEQEKCEDPCVVNSYIQMEYWNTDESIPCRQFVLWRRQMMSLRRERRTFTNRQTSNVRFEPRTIKQCIVCVDWTLDNCIYFCMLEPLTISNCACDK